jgi:CxxC motif-containing protein
MENKKLVCIVCPKGCRLTLIVDETCQGGYRVTGNGCKRGINYGIKELTNPTRVLTSTVKIKGAVMKRLPVRTKGDIPKSLVFECMELLNHIEVCAPIKMGDVIVKNILDTGVDLVASKSMDKI